jgi:FMN reductase
MRLVVVSAGLSQPSSTRLLADRLAQAVRQHVEGELSVTVIELRELAGDLANNLVTGFPALPCEPHSRRSKPRTG